MALNRALANTALSKVTDETWKILATTTSSCLFYDLYHIFKSGV